MSVFEYIAILTSIIIGLGITHLLRGMAELIQSRDHSRIYWLHLCWVAYQFFGVVFWWWWEFGFAAIETWTFGLYFFIIIYALSQFIICTLLFPQSLRDYSGFEEYFYARKKWFFGMVAFSFLLDLLDSWFKGAEHFSSLGNEYLIVTAIEFLLCILAMFINNRYFHALFAIAMVIYQASWAIRMFGSIG